jgi:hypothetical protein
LSANDSNDGASALCSIMRHAFATSAAFSTSFDGPSGLQRRHARNPVALALARVGCSTTLPGLAVREGHDGRQYTPVVETEYQNCPSAVLSRATTRAQRGSSATEASGILEVLASIAVIILDS